AVEDDGPDGHAPDHGADGPRGDPGPLPEGQRDLALLGHRLGPAQPGEGVGGAPRGADGQHSEQGRAGDGAAQAGTYPRRRAPRAAARVAGPDHARPDWVGRWGWNSQVAFPADASRLRGLAAARASHGSSYRLSWKQYRARRAVRVGPPSVSQSRPDAASVVG